MTVPAPGPLTYAYSEDGVTTIFAYPVRFIEAQELIVTRTVAGIVTLLTMGVDYTVSGEGNPSGGSITRTAATSGGTITITRDTTWKQIVDLEDKQRNPAQAVEDQLDRLTMAGQDARAAIGVLQNKTGDLDDAVARAEAAQEDAEAAAEAAEAAQAAAEAAAAGVNLPSIEAGDAGKQLIVKDTEDGYLLRAERDVVRVANRTALAALDGAKTPVAFIYNEGGRNGTFTFVSSDLSAMVAADTQEGIYIAPSSDPTGASGAWVRQGAFSENGLNIEWFGAVADSVTDCSPAIQAAHDLLLATDGSGVIFIPPRRSGYWRMASTVSISQGGVTVCGLNRESTVVISTTGHNFNFFNVSANAFTLRDIRFQAFGDTGTVSRYIVYAPQVHGLLVRNVSAVNIHSGFFNNGSGPLYEGVHLRNLKAAYGVAIDLNESATGEVKRVFHCSFECADGAECFAGIRMRNGSCLEIVDTQIMQCGHCVLLNPQTGERVVSVVLNNVWCDSSDGSGFFVNGATTSSVDRVRIENSWLSSCMFGFRALSPVRGVKIIGTEIYENTNYGIGLQATGHDLKGFIVEGCSIAQSGNDGIYIGSGYTNFQIIGNNIGPDADFSGNTSAALRLAGSNDHYAIIGNMVLGNGSGTIVGHTASATRIAANNIGYP